MTHNGYPERLTEVHLSIKRISAHARRVYRAQAPFSSKKEESNT